MLYGSRDVVNHKDCSLSHPTLKHCHQCRLNNWTWKQRWLTVGVNISVGTANVFLRSKPGGLHFHDAVFRCPRKRVDLPHVGSHVIPRIHSIPMGRSPCSTALRLRPKGNCWSPRVAPLRQFSEVFACHGSWMDSAGCYSS